MKPAANNFTLNILTHSPEEARTDVEAFELSLGKNGLRLAGLVELKRGPFLADGVLELIKNTLKQSLVPLPQPSELEERFEDAVLETNDILAKHFSRDEDSSEHLVGAALILLTSTTVFFTVAKEARAYLVKDGQKHWENLLGSDTGTRGKGVFGSLFSGSIGSEDVLIVASRAFFNSIAQEELRSLIKKNSNNLEEELEHALVDPETPVAALLIRAANTAAARHGATKKQAANQLWKMPSLSGIPAATRVARAAIQQSLSSLIDRLLPPDSKQTPKEPLTQDAPTLNRESQSLKLLPMLMENRKVVVIIALLLLTVGFSSFAAYRARNQRERASYNQILENISATERTINVSLLAHDTQAATELLKKARELLNSIPLSSAARRSRAEVIAKELDAIATKFQFVQVVEPKTIASFSTDTVGQPLHPTFIVLLTQEKKTILLLVDGKLRSIATVDPNTHTPKLDPITVDSSSVGEIVRVLPTEAGALLLTKNNGLFELTLGTTAKIEGKTVDSQPTSVNAAALYQNKLYLIDGTKKQITKHIPTAGGFGKGKIWMNSAPELSTASDLSIDGALWIGTSSGEILRYYQGKGGPFRAMANPTLAGAIQLFTTSDSSFLYALEPQGHRVVVLLKEPSDTNPAGTLVAQYVVDRWTDLKSFTVNEHDKTLSVINGDALEQITLTHLENLKQKPKTKTALPPKKKASPPAKPKKTP